MANSVHHGLRRLDSVSLATWAEGSKRSSDAFSLPTGHMTPAATNFITPALQCISFPFEPNELLVEKMSCQTVLGFRPALSSAHSQLIWNVRDRTTCVFPPVTFWTFLESQNEWSPAQDDERGDDACHLTRCQRYSANRSFTRATLYALLARSRNSTYSSQSRKHQ